MTTPASTPVGLIITNGRGLALSHADPDEPANQLATVRKPV